MWRKVSRFLTSRSSELRYLCLFFHISICFDCSWLVLLGEYERKQYCCGPTDQGISRISYHSISRHLGRKPRKKLLVSSLSMAQMRHTLVKVPARCLLQILLLTFPSHFLNLQTNEEGSVHACVHLTCGTACPDASTPRPGATESSEIHGI